MLNPVGKLYKRTKKICNDSPSLRARKDFVRESEAQRPLYLELVDDFVPYLLDDSQLKLCRSGQQLYRIK